MDEDLLRPGWPWFRFKRFGLIEEIPRVVLDSSRTIVWLV